MSIDNLNRISKPHIVDLLRIIDKNRWLGTHRIRYASVRSKPELIGDLVRRFRVARRDNCLLFRAVLPIVGIPEIQYDLDRRIYLFDGRERDVPRESRKPVLFAIRHGPVTLHFECYTACDNPPAK